MTDNGEVVVKEKFSKMTSIQLNAGKEIGWGERDLVKVFKIK